mgnify:CR=1 FL=1|tara:strand:- start:210 stop:533 length:324 start_codon:yes stop_codon:yes gene_type:complete
MSSIDTSRSSFFPNSKTAADRASAANKTSIMRNDPYRAQQLKDTTSKDAKVDIGDAVRDFSMIKRAVDAAPEVDNTDKIARLKAQIQAGTYQVDYDALADKMLATEF